MGEVVVVVLDGAEDAGGLLDAGARLLRIGGGGRLVALAVRVPPLATIMPSEEVLTARREAELRAGQAQWAGRLKAIVDARMGVEWVDVEGDAAEIVAEHGGRADAIVLARPADHTSERQREYMHAALFDTECPVLVVPTGFARPFGRVVAIAWKEDGGALNAVRASLPILRAAEAVHVLCADASPVLPAVLAEHDIAAELHAADGEGSTAARLLRTAHRVGADLLVMGAFTHGEWRERLFGGVTAAMLAGADLPLLMRH